MGAFEDCYETLIENGRIASFSVEQKVAKVICDEGFKSTGGSNDIPCVGGKWKTDAACVRTSTKNDASRKVRIINSIDQLFLKQNNLSMSHNNLQVRVCIYECL